MGGMKNEYITNFIIFVDKYGAVIYKDFYKVILIGKVIDLGIFWIIFDV